MDEKLIRKGWYDGWFYAWFIDSNFTSFRNRIFKYLDKDKKIIDVGCGTGGFSLRMAERCNFVLGIDISKKQIDMAQKRLEHSNVTNARFIHSNAIDLKNHINEIFDFAILTFVIHEVAQSTRIRILKHIKEFAHNVLILDYHHPMSKNFSGYSIRLTEFFAGRDHYKNFVDYNTRGGLLPLLEEAGLEIIQDRINRPQVFRTVLAKNVNKRSKKGPERPGSESLDI
jgi:SAM-dependent methyltransferase